MSHMALPILISGKNSSNWCLKNSSYTLKIFLKMSSTPWLTCKPRRHWTVFFNTMNNRQKNYNSHVCVSYVRLKMVKKKRKKSRIQCTFKRKVSRDFLQELVPGHIGFRDKSIASLHVLYMQQNVRPFLLWFGSFSPTSTTQSQKFIRLCCWHPLPTVKLQQVSSALKGQWCQWYGLCDFLIKIISAQFLHTNAVASSILDSNSRRDICDQKTTIRYGRWVLTFPRI